MACLVDPAGEAIPLAQQRFVRHFDGRSSGGGVTIEHEQPMPSERFEHPIESCTPTQQLQLAPTDPAAGVLCVFIDGDQSNEHVTGELAFVGGKAQIDVLGAATDRTDQSAGVSVVPHVEQVELTVVEHLGEHVLQERQRSRLLAGVGHHRLDQCVGDVHVHGGGGASDDLGQFGVDGHRNRHVETAAISPNEGCCRGLS